MAVQTPARVPRLLGMRSALILMAFSTIACGVTEPRPTPSPTVFVDTAPGASCQLSTSECIYALQVAQAQLGIDSDSMVTIVRPPPGPVRTAPDIALLVVTDVSGKRHLILVGRVGVDPEARAWVPDPASYAEWYRAFDAE